MVLPSPPCCLVRIIVSFFTKRHCVVVIRHGSAETAIAVVLVPKPNASPPSIGLVPVPSAGGTIRFSFCTFPACPMSFERKSAWVFPWQVPCHEEAREKS